jgi:hypothetical protein
MCGKLEGICSGNYEKYVENAIIKEKSWNRACTRNYSDALLLE